MFSLVVTVTEFAYNTNFHLHKLYTPSVSPTFMLILCQRYLIGINQISADLYALWSKSQSIFNSHNMQSKFMPAGLEAL